MCPDMDIEITPPRCVSCEKPMTFAGRISLPPEIIYRCELCRTEIWLGNAPRAMTPLVTERPQVQQQQQPQQLKNVEEGEPA